MLSAFVSFAALASVASAAPHPHAHVDSVRGLLPTRWYHDDAHPVYDLFRRQSPSTGSPSFPTVGSPQWSAGFPQTADTKSMPQAWTNALNSAISSGAIPSNVPVSTQSSSGSNPTYGNLNPNTLPVCSATEQCVLPGQIWNATDGVAGISFDDGPLPPSDGLYQFLQQNNIPSTHFYIGTNILQYPQQFMFAFQTLGSDIAVHTWTHPYMTTLSNEAVLAELGWTMLLIYNSTGGRVPRYWRPPYGDTDARVDAIAREVFGLTTMIWNQDTNDWSLDESGGTNQAAINANFDKWLSGPKTGGLIILEHELTNDSVQAFKNNYAKYAQHGWTVKSAAQIQGYSYQNAQNSSGPMSALALLGAGMNATLLPPTAAPSSAAPTPTSGNSSASGAAASASASASTKSGASNKSGAASRFSAGLSLPLALLSASAGLFFGAF